MNETVKRLLERRLVDELDAHFAGLMLRLDGDREESLALAAALLSQWRQRGHACLDLGALRVLDEQGEEFPLPETESWKQALLRSPVVGAPHEFKPLILTGQGRLYLRRYWQYEEEVFFHLSKRMASEDLPVDGAALAGRLDRLFPGVERTDDQRVAVEIAMRKRFCVISGGPGTGKTTTAVRLLALLLMDEGARPPRIRLAAPTGKAAARLEESIAECMGDLPLSEAMKEHLPSSASTLHRLLRFRGGSSIPWHGEDRPLGCDVLMVDEASMVDLALMAKLLRAAPPACRVILLGDKDQLASVEAGSVLGDICLDGASGRLAGHIALLRKNYRFGEDSGIGALSRAVNEGASPEALRLLQDEARDDLAWRTVGEDRLQRELPALAGRFTGLARHRDPEAAHRELASFRILCAVRRGPFGVEAVNEEIRKHLPVGAGPWYAGRPVMVTENDYHLDLFNGDLGITLRRPQDGELRVWFQRRDGSMRAFHPGRLPPHETVYAMTVHKSQGSQFEEVLLLLPARPAPVLSRELIYTAVTRARSRVTVWGREEIVAESIGRKVERYSGLREYFRDAGSGA